MNIKRWLSAIIIIFVVIAGLGFVKFSQIQAMIAFAASFPEPSASVKSTYVQPIEHLKTTKVIGQLQAPRIITLSNEYPGSITQVGFKPGDMVSDEQVLLTLDTRLENANLSAAKARLKLAKSTYKRVAKLLKQNRISQDEVDRAQADVSIAEAEIANLTSIIDKKTIRAPFAGRVGLNQYQVGQLLDANSQITTLVGQDPSIWVDFAIPQTLPQLTIGSQIEIAVAHSHNPKRHNGIVIAKNPQIDVNSRQQTYRVEINNQNFELQHNQMVSVFVPLEQVTAMSVPTNAITRNHFGHFVYQLKQDEQQNWRATPIKVTLGEKVKDQQIILSGLNGGEFIASEGAFKLKENLLVYTQQTAALTNKAGGE